MKTCEKALINRIICDENFHIQHALCRTKIGDIAVPPKSTIEGTVEVAVLECMPIINCNKDTISVKIGFFIQQELMINLPDCRNVPLEFGYRMTKTVSFRRCTPSKLRHIDSGLLSDLECCVTDLAAKDLITLHPSCPPYVSNATFDELLILDIKLLLIHTKPLTVALCPSPNYIRIKNVSDLPACNHPDSTVKCQNNYPVRGYGNPFG